MKKDISILHAELGHPSKVIIFTTGRVINFYHTGLLHPCEDCALGKAKKGNVDKKAVDHSKVLEERLFFDISLLLTPTLGGKNHWLLVIEDGTDYVWN